MKLINYHSSRLYFTIYFDQNISVCLCSTSQTDITVIKHILQQHRIKELTSSNDEDVQHLRVRRSNIFSDALRQFSKDSFNCSKLLRVTFIGEAAVDDGGPGRELFHLVI